MIQEYGILGVGYAWIFTYGMIMIVIGWIALREKWI